MKASTSKSGLALVCATLLLVLSFPAVAGKPTKPGGGGGGGGTDPCIGARDRGFPSFVFTKQAVVEGVSTWGIFLTDSDAKCERLVGSYPYSRTVNLRFDPAMGTGLLMHDSDGYALVASTFTVSFVADGSPSVTATAFSTVLSPADLPEPADYVGNPNISPDGQWLLLTSHDASWMRKTAWVCPMEAGGVIGTAPACRSIHSSTDGSFVQASWGGTAESVYVVDASTEGDSRTVYRLDLADSAPTPVPVWTAPNVNGVKAKNAPSGGELLALYVTDQPTCWTIVVIDANSCPGSNCQALNGSGHPARTMAWLPDGRLAGEGQTAPNRKGRCSPSGWIVTFDPADTGGTTAPLTQGQYPDGAQGG